MAGETQIQAAKRATGSLDTASLFSPIQFQATANTSNIDYLLVPRAVPRVVSQFELRTQ
jgi:hypothetical protein